jgi:amidohydrolase
MDYPIIYVETLDQLEELHNILLAREEFALDLEADVNLHRYGRKLCLAQVWDGECCWLIDATVLDLSPLKDVMEDSGIIKVMYSASFDASLLADISGISLKGLFDLQVCTSQLGNGKRSLKHFMKELFDLDLQKDLQTSDWFRRPLTSEQIKYASLDVRYLLEARAILLPQLEAEDLLESVWDICQKVEQSRFQEVSNPHLRVRYSARLTPYQRLFLEEYFWVREKIAQALDLPAYRVMRSYQLLHLVIHPPYEETDFDTIDFFDDRLKEYKAEFLASTCRAHSKVLEKNLLVKKEVIELRRLLHKHPELSGKETGTIKRLHRFVRNFDPSRVMQNIGRTGILYEFAGKEAGPCVIFRSELDAIQGKELSNIPWSSREKKAVHLHGNDGHTAILAGLAARIYGSRISKGKVILLFQPSAENGKGAIKVLKEKRFQDLKPDLCFALQNLPGYPEGSLVITKGAFALASIGLILKLRNASQSEEAQSGKDFSAACSEIINLLTNVRSEESSQANLIFLQLGKQNFTQLPQQAEMRIKLVSNSDINLEKFQEKVLESIHAICHLYNLENTCSFTDNFPGLESSEEGLNIIRKIAEKNKHELIVTEKFFPWSEDFGHFAQIAPVAMIGLGAGVDHPHLGSTHYDFPDNLINTAIDILSEILEELEIISPDLKNPS